MNNKEIFLTEEEQLWLQDIVRKGEHNAHMITRARALLLLDRTGKKDHVRYKRTAEYTGLSVQSVYNMRDEFLTNTEKWLSCWLYVIVLISGVIIGLLITNWSVWSLQTRLFVLPPRCCRSMFWRNGASPAVFIPCII